MDDPGDVTLRSVPLAQLHRRLGAVPAAVDGYEIPARYSSVDEEYRVLRQRCGLVDLTWVDRLEVQGADRLRFVNGLVTCDVRSLQSGSGVYGYFTTAQGKTLADVVVLALEDRLWLELPAGRGEAIAAHMRKYLVADRVEIAPLSDRLPLAFVGPACEDLLAAAGEAPPRDPWSHRRMALAGAEVELVRIGHYRLPYWHLWVDAAVAVAFAESLLAGSAGGREQCPQPVGWEALEILRVEEGVPRWSQEFGEETLPQELGNPSAVSYEKGCYLGQEVVARIQYRGQVNRALRGLRFAGAERPLGAVLLEGGREAGEVTSAVDSPALGCTIGLALLHRRAAEPGTRLELADGGQAEVLSLPMV